MGTVFAFPFRTVSEVSLRALVKNYATLRSMTRKEVIPVVKADAYGHGMLQVARALVGRGSAQMLAVATLDEGMELRKKIPPSVGVLVLSGYLPHQVDAYLKYSLTPVLHTISHLKNLLGRKNFPDFHLKVDTGMHRLGIQPEEMSEAIRLLTRVPVKLAGFMTHFAESESLTSTFTDKQLRVFEEIYRVLQDKRLLATDARVHVANSGAILRGKLGFTTAVRAGLALYGISPNPNLDSSSLIPVLQWKARVLCVKSVARGSTVGYGRTYKAKRKERIAILPIGYADGYPRLLSNRGHVLVGGKRAPVRGRISMDMTAIDFPASQTLREGTVVTLIGHEGKERISAWDIAEWAGTVPYEILCGISARVPRIYIE